jgi:hypothetical protein
VVLTIQIAVSMILLTMGTSRSMASCPKSPDGVGRAESVRYMDDSVGGGRWAVVTDCRNPGSPARLLELPHSDSAARTLQGHPNHPTSVVFNGTHVLLWRQASFTRVTLDAIALQNGAVGDTISLRLASGGAVLKGIVRNAGNVELQLSGKLERLQ